MADIHVLKGSAPDANQAVTTQIVFHFAIPGVDQVANAAQDPELVGFESAVPDIGGVELAAIQAGETVEESLSFRWHPTEAQSELVTRIRAAYTARKPDAIAAYVARYRSYLTTLAE